jgi:hypothetical protein
MSIHPLFTDFGYFDKLFRLDIVTGQLFNRYMRPGKAFKDWEAGCLDPNGYRCVTIQFKGKRKKYYTHNIVWLLTHGEWPPEHHLGNKARIIVDHKNRRRDDNRPENLQLATRYENAINTISAAESMAIHDPCAIPL